MSPSVAEFNPPDAATLKELQDCSNRMRILAIKSTNAAKSGHPTSAASAADIVSVLFFQAMNYDPKNPRDPNSDRFVMSKGHACPLLYAAWAEAGHIPQEELLNLRKIDCDLEGHPTPRLDFVDVATGSLGQGLSCSAGMAYTGKYFDQASYRVYCLVGDGEMAEGSVWEAAAFSSYYKLDNLIAIFDINRLGQSQHTALQHDVDTYQRRLEAFGWHAMVVDGHDITALSRAFSDAKRGRGHGKPIAIVAKTFKGRGMPGIEDQDNWHGKALSDHAGEVIAALEAGLTVKNGPTKLAAGRPVQDAPKILTDFSRISLSEPPEYQLGEKVATRMAYGTALVKLGQGCDRVVALDGDVKNSTFSDKFRNAFPGRFIECFIAEQNMVGVGIGCSTRGRMIPFCSTFATFFTRAFDQLRMGAVSMANLKCSGSHVGVSIGEDGPSQMGLEDLALFRTLPGSTVFYPSDAVSCERSVELAARVPGICFIRTGRPATPVIYKNEEVFEIGKAKVVRESENDSLVLVGAGVTLMEALKAADTLKSDGINVCVIDLFTVKPIDSDTLINRAKSAGNQIITVEDHYPEGGIGEAVAGAVSEAGVKVRKMAVSRLPRSGPPDVLLEVYGISAKCIVATVKELLGK